MAANPDISNETAHHNQEISCVRNLLGYLRLDSVRYNKKPTTACNVLMFHTQLSRRYRHCLVNHECLSVHLHLRIHNLRIFAPKGWVIVADYSFRRTAVIN
jgi:hypothetical protein